MRGGGDTRPTRWLRSSCPAGWPTDWLPGGLAGAAPWHAFTSGISDFLSPKPTTCMPASRSRCTSGVKSESDETSANPSSAWCAPPGGGGGSDDDAW
eukprot:COSAG01_NODE_30816_length_609_cov_0.807843_2_plen_96_part_01